MRPMPADAGSEYRERHRQRYAVLLDRIVAAYQQPEAVRLEHAGLLSRLVRLARDERIKATSGFLHDETAPIGDNDPLIASTDKLLGNVEDIARGIAEHSSICFETTAEYLAAMGAVIVSGDTA